jgi:hypothetical protein
MNNQQRRQVTTDIRCAIYVPGFWRMPTEAQARCALARYNDWLTNRRRNCTNEGADALDFWVYRGAIARINAYLVFLRSGVYDV